MATRKEDMQAPKGRVEINSAAGTATPVSAKEHRLFLAPDEVTDPYRSKKLGKSERAAAQSTIETRLAMLKELFPDLKWNTTGSHSGDDLLLWAQISGGNTDKNKMLAQQIVEPLSAFLPDIRYGRVAGTDCLLLLPRFNAVEEKVLQEASQFIKDNQWIFEAYHEQVTSCAPITEKYIQKQVAKQPVQMEQYATELKKVAEKMEQSGGKPVIVSDISHLKPAPTIFHKLASKEPPKELGRMFVILKEFCRRSNIRYVTYGQIKGRAEAFWHPELRQYISEQIADIASPDYIDGILVVNLSERAFFRVYNDAKFASFLSVELGDEYNLFLEKGYNDQHKVCLKKEGLNAEALKAFLIAQKYDFIKVTGGVIKFDCIKFASRGWKDDEQLKRIREMLAVAFSASVDAKSAAETERAASEALTEENPSKDADSKSKTATKEKMVAN